MRSIVTVTVVLLTLVVAGIIYVAHGFHEAE